MFSLVIPTYNERQNIEVLIPRLIDLLRSYVPFEIIVADDDSPDLTWQAVEDLSSKFPEVRLLRRFNQKGLSAAVIDGFLNAKGNVLGVMDADMQHDESLLPAMISALKEYPIVVGSRFLESGSLGEAPFYRRAASWLANRLAKPFLRVNLKDPMSGFFVLRKDIFERCADRLNPRGFKILFEIIHCAKVDCIKEIPFTFGDRLHGESKMNHRIGLDFIRSLFEKAFGLHISIRFLRFCAVGLIGTAVNLLMLFILTTWVGMKQDVALLLAIFTAMISNYVINNRWTFGEYRVEGFLNILGSFLRFCCICSTGAFLNFCVAIVLNEKLGLNIYISNIVGITISAIWNFMQTKWIIWKAPSNSSKE